MVYGSMYSLVPSHATVNNIYLFVLVCTGMYLYILNNIISWMVGTSMYCYILNNVMSLIVYTGTYKYIPVHTELWICQHCPNQYIPVRTRTSTFSRFCTRSKKCNSVSNSQSSAYYEQNLPLSYWGTELGTGMLNKQLSLYIQIVAVTRLVCAPGVW